MDKVFSEIFNEKELFFIEDVLNGIIYDPIIPPKPFLIHDIEDEVAFANTDLKHHINANKLIKKIADCDDTVLLELIKFFRPDDFNIFN